MKYKFPVDVVIECDSPEEAKVLVEGFMLRAVSEHRKEFFVSDYDFPYGYPVEPVDE